MSIKVENIMKHYVKNGAVNIKMDASFGAVNIKIQNRGGVHVVSSGVFKGAMKLMDIRTALEESKIYIESFN